MQGNIHHFASFAIEHVEGRFQVLLVELAGAGGEAWRHVEFAVIAIVIVRLCFFIFNTFLLANSVVFVVLFCVLAPEREGERERDGHSHGIFGGLLMRE